MQPPAPGILDKQYMQVLFPYAYIILGSAEDARDAVQEVLVKHLSGPGHPIADPKSYLIRSVINLAITMKSRQKKTLRPGERWLPEPVATDDAADRNLHLSDVLSYALLVLMERLDAHDRNALAGFLYAVTYQPCSHPHPFQSPRHWLLGGHWFHRV